MTTETLYNIYARGECLYKNLSKSEFNNKWIELNAIVGLMKTDYTEEDLTYIKLPANSGENGREGSVNTEPPGEPSY